MSTVGGTGIAQGRPRCAVVQAGTLALQAAGQADSVALCCGTFRPLDERPSDDGLRIIAGRGETLKPMRRKIFLSALTLALFVAGFALATWPAVAELRTITITLVGGQQIVTTVDVPPGTPAEPDQASRDQRPDRRHRRRHAEGLAGRTARQRRHRPDRHDAAEPARPGRTTARRASARATRPASSSARPTLNPRSRPRATKPGDPRNPTARRPTQPDA